MAIKYTTTHSSGLTKTRTSKDHAAPRYTHAVWVNFPEGKWPGRNGWECRSIASEKTARYEAERFQRAGFETEIATVVAH